MFIVPTNHLSVYSHKQTDARDRKRGHTALTLLKQSGSNYNPAPPAQPRSRAHQGQQEGIFQSKHSRQEGVGFAHFSHLKVSQINPDEEDTTESQPFTRNKLWRPAGFRLLFLSLSLLDSVCSLSGSRPLAQTFLVF